MAVLTDSTNSKNIDVSQISSTYTTATVRIKYRLSKTSWYLGSGGFKVMFEGSIVNQERTTPWYVSRVYTPVRGSWTYKGAGSALTNKWNTNRILLKARYIDWNRTYSSNYGRQHYSGSYYYSSSTGDERHILVGAEEYSEDITYILGTSYSSRTNSRNITAGIAKYDGGQDADWTGLITIPISTTQIPAPSTPTISYSLINYGEVGGLVRIAVSIPSNVENFYTLSLEDITTGVTILKTITAGVSFTHDIILTEAYYDTTHTYRARVAKADINYTKTMTVYVEAPVMPIWYYLTASDKVVMGVTEDRLQVKQISYYNSSGNKVKVKQFWWNNGGSYQG